MRYFLDRSVHETSEELGLSQDAVRSHTKRAIAALRQRFSDVEHDLALEARDD